MARQQTIARPVVETASVKTLNAYKKPNTLWGDIGAHIFLIFLSLVVLFPVVWVIAIALDPRDITRPTSLIPVGASFAAFERIFTQPQANGVYVVNALW